MFRTALRCLLSCVLALTTLMLLNCSKSSSGGGVGSSCKTLDECKIGTICGADSKCEQKGCTTALDCGNGEVCLESGFCSKPECSDAEPCPSGKNCQGGVCHTEQTTCTDNSQCQNGQVCKSGICADPGKCSTKADCQAGQSCKNGACETVAVSEPCVNSAECGVGQYCDSTGKCASGCSQDTDCPTTDYCDNATNQCKTGCRVADGCSDNRQCDATSHTCKCTQTWCDANGGGNCDSVTGECKTGQTTGDLCKACTKDGDCGGVNDLCSAIGEGSFCTKACTQQSDCPAGYYCYDITNDSKQCVPSSFKCIGCIQAGCPDSTKTCNFDTGECVTKKKTCEACTQNYECGAGNFCFTDTATSQRFCVEGCTESGTCGTGFSCNALSGGDGSIKVCEPDGGSCSLCAGVTCNAPNGHCKPETGLCVECTDNTHCTGASGSICDLATNKCVDENPCQPPLPFYVNGSCVECVFNNDCPNGPCNNNVCSGGQQGGNCQKDADCTASLQFSFSGDPTQMASLINATSCNSSDGFTFVCPLKCDTASGKCYEPGGLCDDNVAFCASGSTCAKTGQTGSCGCSLLSPTCFAGQSCNLNFLAFFTGGSAFTCQGGQ